MAFLAPIAAAIGGAISTVAGVVGGIGAAIGSAVGAVTSFLSSTVVGVVGAIGSAVSGAFSLVKALVGSSAPAAAQSAIGVAQTLGGGGAGVIGTVTSFFHDVGTLVTGIVEPIGNFVGQIRDFVNNINQNFIQPIRDVVTGTYQAWESLKTSLANDVHEGILGFLKIPGDLADALTSVDAQFSRATQTLGEFNQQIAAESLVPGIGGRVGDSIDGLLGQLKTYGQPGYETIGQFPQVMLSGLPSAAEVANAIGTWLNNTGHATGPMATIINWLGDALSLLPAFEAAIRPRMRRIEQDANSSLPETPLDPSQVVRAMYRGIMSTAEGQAELLRHGISPDRLQVMIENESWLPSLAELILLVQRQAISADDAAKVATDKGLSAADWIAFQNAVQEPPNPLEAIRFQARRQGAEAVSILASLRQDAPQEVQEYERERVRRGDTGDMDWVNHWKVPPLEWWITRYLRGIGSLEEMYAAATAEQIPPEIIPDLVSIYQRTVELWMIPDMIASGIMTEAESIGYLHYIGLGDRDAQLIVQYGLGKAKAPVAGQAADLSKISAASAKTMFEDGIINQDQYLEVLTAHAYSAEAAELTVALTVQEQAIAQRKTNATYIVDQVNAGILSESDGVSQLYALGYTTEEVFTYVQKIKSTKVAKTKQLSASELKDALLYGVIGPTQWATSMQQIGYQNGDITTLYGVFLAQHGEPPVPIGSVGSGQALGASLGLLG